MRKQLTLDTFAGKLDELEAHKHAPNSARAIILVLCAGFAFYVLCIVISMLALGIRGQMALLPDVAATCAGLTLAGSGGALLRIVMVGVHTQVYVMESERVEYRFVQTKDKGVPVEDLHYFIERVELTGKSGVNSMRGVPFPSGTKMNDNYYGLVCDALVAAGVWNPSVGARKAGCMRVSYDEALALLPPPSSNHMHQKRYHTIDRG